MKSLKTASLSDTLHIISIEASLSRALPAIDIVGLAGASIKESSTRVKSALNLLSNSLEEAKLPPLRININLSPSGVKKDGSHFDLGIALLIMLQKRHFNEDFFVFGELGLDGAVKSSAELFSILLFLSTQVNSAKILLPKDIALKAAMIPNFEVYAISSLEEAFYFFTNDEFASSKKVQASHPLFEKTIKIGDKIFVPNLEFPVDFKDIYGQDRAKRACVISAAGFHNIIFEGSPGCGKSMSAKRLRYILPPQSKEEVLKACAYESLNATEADFSALRPFRSPHHTSTRSSIFGGGSSVAKIGEVALANGGILFFDELPHFGSNILESLREPLQDNRINISRVNSKISYDTKFLFVGAMNPCPCGNALNTELVCTCSPKDIKRYKASISGALMDRIDLYVLMSSQIDKTNAGLDSGAMSELVMRGFRAQISRGQSELNGKLDEADIAKYCICDKAALDVIQRAASTYNLSQRAINKTLKVARTIADIAQNEIIAKEHALEALGYRFRA